MIVDRAVPIVAAVTALVVSVSTLAQRAGVASPWTCRRRHSLGGGRTAIRPGGNPKPTDFRSRFTIAAGSREDQLVLHAVLSGEKGDPEYRQTFTRQP